MSKITALVDIHRNLGAKMMDFAGYSMPVQYTSIQEEHLAVRSNVGIFDVSHMGEFIIKGKEALDLIQTVSTNDASKLEIGQAQYSCLPNSDGGIVDDFLLYRLPEDKCADGERAYMLVVNASNIDKDWAWISKHNTYDCDMVNISSRSGLLAVQGPKAIDLVQHLTDVDLTAIPYYSFTKGVVADIPNVLISATGYTGSGGFELYVDNAHLQQLWEALFAISDLSPVPVGLGARDTLRLEMGYCLYGNDIDDTTSPLEAGLSWITKLKKESDFNSKSIFIDQKSNGTQNKLVGFVMEDRRVPRHGYPICNIEGIEIGRVTSGTLSPSLQQPIGMGYVTKTQSKIGTEILVDTGRKKLKAIVVKMPFYKR